MVEDVLIRVNEFICLADFVILETNRVADVANQVPVILEHPFLAISNAFINCMNGMMRLSFGNMTLELRAFNL